MVLKICEGNKVHISKIDIDKPKGGDEGVIIGRANTNEACMTICYVK